MGHQVNTRHRPRRGSMGYWHRKRAKRAYPVIKSLSGGEGRSLAFTAYKAGMTQAVVVDNIKTSRTKGEQVVYPVTILEAPPLRIAGIRFYKKDVYGARSIGEVWADKHNKELKRRIILRKKPEGKKIEDYPDFDEVRLIAYTQPKMIKLKKTPELLEIPVGGGKDAQLSLAKTLLGSELRVNDVLKEGVQLDVSAVSKGKGVQGSVKRFGVRIGSHKAEKIKRTVGTMRIIPRRVSFRIPQYGQMGFHNRTDFKKWLLKIGSKPEEVNPKGGFIHYGNVNTDFLVIKGSIPGPKKRLVCLYESRRASSSIPGVPPQILSINKESKQGV